MGDQIQPIDEGNGPVLKYVQSVCHDTLPWLISVLLGDSSMALFGLIFLFVMLVLIGVGIAVGFVACVIAAVLVAVGMLSSSVVIGVLARRTSVGVRAFLLQLAVLLGVPSGVLCAWLAHWIFSAPARVWLISLYGAMGGAVAGVVLALLLDFIFRRLHRWASAKISGATRREIAAPVA
jgi:MFS family permease